MKGRLAEEAAPKTPPKQHRSLESSIDDPSDVGGSNEPAIESNLPHIQLHNEIAASKFSEGV